MYSVDRGEVKLTYSRARRSSRRRVDVLRVVTLASRRGAYGGPFSTAQQQVVSAGRGGLTSLLFAGYEDGDAPELQSGVDQAVLCRGRRIPFTPRFTGLISVRIATELWRQTGISSAVHVSFARELLPIASTAIAIARRRPVIIQTHGMVSTDSRWWIRILDVFLRPLVRRAAALIALTESEAESVKTWCRTRSGRVAVLGNGVSDELLARPVEVRSRKVESEVLFAARLHPRKRVTDFIDAAYTARELGLKGRYVVIGPDDGDLNAVEQASRAGIVEYRGAAPPDRVDDEVASCSVFVLPSLDEPWGNVLVSAIAQGKPVVISRSSALAGLVERYGCGVVFADGDGGEIARAVDRLLSDDRQYAMMSQKGRALAQGQFSARIINAKLVQLYRSVTSVAQERRDRFPRRGRRLRRGEGRSGSCG